MCNEILKYFGYKIVRTDDIGDIPPPDIVRDIDNWEVNFRLQSEFHGIPILLPDWHYQIATKASFEEFLRYDKTNEYTYTGDPGIDCDNFAHILTGHTSIPKWGTVPIGTIWFNKPAHALNWFLDEKLEVWLCEPQNDRLYKTPDHYEPSILWA